MDSQHIGARKRLPANRTHDVNIASHPLAKPVNERGRSSFAPVYRKLQRAYLNTSVYVRLCIAVVGLALLFYCLQRASSARRAGNVNIPSFAKEISAADNAYRAVDNDLVDSFPMHLIGSLAHIRETPDGIFLSAVLKNSTLASVHIAPPLVPMQSPSNLVGNGANAPCLHRLAHLLKLEHAVLPSHELAFPIIADPTVMDRHVARSLLRALGYRSKTRVPEGAVVRARITLFPGGVLTRRAILRTPAIEPYDWDSSLLSSEECRRAFSTSQLPARSEAVVHTVRICRDLIEVMLVAFVGGCAPVGNMDLFVPSSSGEDKRPTLLLGLPGGCFGKGVQSLVTRDILLEYLDAICELPAGLIASLEAVSNISWDVGSRAKELLRILAASRRSSEQSLCDAKGWSFFTNDY